MIKNKKSKGFTLIELLLVFAIISLLSSIVLAVTRDLRARAQDTRIVREAIELQKAVELYYLNNGYYPHQHPTVAAQPGLTQFFVERSRNANDTISVTGNPMNFTIAGATQLSTLIQFTMPDPGPISGNVLAYRAGGNHAVLSSRQEVRCSNQVSPAPYVIVFTLQDPSRVNLPNYQFKFASNIPWTTPTPNQKCLSIN